MWLFKLKWIKLKIRFLSHTSHISSAQSTRATAYDSADMEHFSLPRKLLGTAALERQFHERGILISLFSDVSPMENGASHIVNLNKFLLNDYFWEWFLYSPMNFPIIYMATHFFVIGLCPKREYLWQNGCKIMRCSLAKEVNIVPKSTIYC